MVRYIHSPAPPQASESCRSNGARWGVSENKSTLEDLERYIGYYDVRYIGYYDVSMGLGVLVRQYGLFYGTSKLYTNIFNILMIVINNDNDR